MVIKYQNISIDIEDDVPVINHFALEILMSLDAQSGFPEWTLHSFDDIQTSKKHRFPGPAKKKKKNILRLRKNSWKIHIVQKKKDKC